jgi:hypothetical protein
VQGENAAPILKQSAFLVEVPPAREVLLDQRSKLVCLPEKISIRSAIQ